MNSQNNATAVSEENCATCCASKQPVEVVFYDSVGTVSFSKRGQLNKWSLSHPQWSMSLFLLLLPALISMQMRQDNKGELGLEQQSDI